MILRGDAFNLECVQDLALATAAREGAEYVLAQDPDSDRFSAAEKQYVPCTSLAQPLT